MPKHRVDLGLMGMAHYVDDQFVDATGFPLWEKELPRGLHLERRVGSPTNQDRKFVKSPNGGTGVEWISNRV